jgi:histone H3/H4
MADEFSRSVARVIAAQIAEASGFEACQESAIEILADLLLRYLTTVCSSSHSYAELAGRSQSNLADVLLSLEELGVTADDLHQHLELQVSWLWQKYICLQGVRLCAVAVRHVTSAVSSAAVLQDHYCCVDEWHEAAAGSSLLPAQHVRRGRAPCSCSCVFHVRPCICIQQPYYYLAVLPCTQPL